MRYLILLCLLAGCSSVPIVDTVVQRAPTVAVPDIAPLSLAPMQWQVLNAADLQALAAKMKGNKDFVLFSLDADNYENFNLNLIEIKRFLSQQKSIIILLKKVSDQDSAVVDTSALMIATKPKSK